MNKLTTIQKQTAVTNAIASVRLEGLEPSEATKKRLALYAEGKLSASDVRERTLREAQQLAQPAAV